MKQTLEDWLTEDWLTVEECDVRLRLAVHMIRAALTEDPNEALRGTDSIRAAMQAVLDSQNNSEK